MDAGAERKAVAHMDQLTKPRGALGELETIWIRLAGITGQTQPQIGNKRVAVFLRGSRGDSRRGQRLPC